MLDPVTKILVVDDSRFMRHIIKNYLKAIGLENVVEAANGREALALLNTGKVDLILSDLSMPGMNGVEFLKAVRADADLKDTPFIMVTAEAQPHIVFEAKKARVSKYVLKPFTPKILRKNIEKALCRRKND